MRESNQRQAGIDVELTQEMVEAGVAELREHLLGEKLEVIVADVFHAMIAAN